MIGCFLETQRDTTYLNEKLWQRINDPETEHSTPMAQKQVPDSKYPSQSVTKSIERCSMDQGKPTQKLDHESDHRHSRIGRNSTAPGASDQPRGVVGPVGPWGPTLNQARV